MKDIHQREKQYHIFPLSKNFYFHLSDAAKAWFEGAEFPVSPISLMLTKARSCVISHVYTGLAEMRVSSAIDDDLKMKYITA